MLLPASSIHAQIEVTSMFIRLSCNNFCIICCGVYIPPGLSKTDHDLIIEFLISDLELCLSQYLDYKLIVARDFNDLDPVFLCESLGVVNRVTEATRQNAILDHILVDDNLCDHYENPTSVGPPLKNSNHNCIFLSPLPHRPSGKDCWPLLV